MILLDPHLDTHAAPKASSAKRTAASAAAASKKNLRLPSAQTLARFVAAAQLAVGLKGEVTILLTTDAAIRGLNRRFRGKNKATDVLSFPAAGLGAGGIAGDLAISVTTALGQAAGQGHSLSTEIKVLVLHGLLHLAGYDHETDNGKMARREMLLRERLGLPEGLIERSTESKSSALKGHAFSRAVNTPKKIAALAAGGIPVSKKDSPQGLKPKSSSRPQSARLKSSPFKTIAKAART